MMLTRSDVSILNVHSSLFPPISSPLPWDASQYLYSLTVSTKNFAFSSGVSASIPCPKFIICPAPAFSIISIVLCERLSVSEIEGAKRLKTPT